MTALIPNRFLFHFEFPLHYRSRPPVINGHVDDWTDDDLLPKLGELDGLGEFADVWVCWNEAGLWVACRVVDKRQPLRCDPRTFWTGDNLRLCTDMRDARANKRATRFCQQFYFLPTGGGLTKKEPVAGVNKITHPRGCPADPGWADRRRFARDRDGIYVGGVRPGRVSQWVRSDGTPADRLLLHA